MCRNNWPRVTATLGGRGRYGIELCHTTILPSRGTTPATISLFSSYLTKIIELSKSWADFFLLSSSVSHGQIFSYYRAQLIMGGFFLNPLQKVFNPTRISLHPPWRTLVCYFMSLPKHEEWHITWLAPHLKFFHPSCEKMRMFAVNAKTKKISTYSRWT